ANNTPVRNVSACFPQAPSTFHTAGLQVALGDGSCRTVGSGVTTSWPYATVPNDGTSLGSNWRSGAGARISHEPVLTHGPAERLFGRADLFRPGVGGFVRPGRA